MLLNSERLKVGGLVPLTTRDLPTQLSAVIFCQGCPWKCRFCQNPHLIPRTSGNSIEWDDIINFLSLRIGLLDGVVFSGGEPTMQRVLPDAVREVSALGYKIGLHTAGQFPHILKETLAEVTWIGMDIKAPPEKYKGIIGRDLRWGSILQSARLIIESGIDYEFRTTFHPYLLTEKDLLDVGLILSNLGCDHFVLQSFRDLGCIDQELNAIKHSPIISKELFCELKSMFKDFSLRSFSDTSTLTDFII